MIGLEGVNAHADRIWSRNSCYVGRLWAHHMESVDFLLEQVLVCAA